MSNTKGLAIRLDNKTINRIEKHELSRNDLIQKAVVNYLNNNKNNNSDFEETIPDDVYDEIYNTIYNTEMSPLKQKIKHQKDIINLLNEQINEIKKDKKFLQEQIIHLQTNNKKEKIPIRTRIKRKFSKKIKDDE